MYIKNMQFLVSIQSFFVLGRVRIKAADETLSFYLKNKINKIKYKYNYKIGFLHTNGEVISL